MQQNVIMDCLDDPDISIRLQALELAVQMTTSDTLQDIVNRLLTQLLTSQQSFQQDPRDDTIPSGRITGDTENATSMTQKRVNNSLPAEYKIDVATRILDICSRENYADIVDFEWYIEILEKLLKLLPHINASRRGGLGDDSMNSALDADLAARIGAECRSVAVRVRAVREKATRTAESFLFLVDMQQIYQNALFAYVGALGPVAWMIGEFSQYLLFPDRILNILTNPSNKLLPRTVLVLYLQAIPKVFLRLINSEHMWSASSHPQHSITLARLIAFMEDLGTHPILDVQERATEFLELLRLAKDVLQPNTTGKPPFLVSEILPGLFKGLELNSVSIEAQKRVPLPTGLDLDKAMSTTTPTATGEDRDMWAEAEVYNDIKVFYHTSNGPQVLQKELGVVSQTELGFDHADFYHESYNSGQERINRRERNRDDPFYIGFTGETSTDTIKVSLPTDPTANQEDLDIESIPIIDLQAVMSDSHSLGADKRGRRSKVGKYHIAADETIDYDGSSPANMAKQMLDSKSSAGRSLLQVDSSGLQNLTLNEAQSLPVLGNLHHEQAKNDQDPEMIEAMRKIERVRLEMQRTSERLDVQGLPSDGQLIKKKAVKKKKKKKITSDGIE